MTFLAWTRQHQQWQNKGDPKRRPARKCKRTPTNSGTATDLDVTDLGFRGPGFRSPRQVLCGDASRLSFDHFSKHLSSVLGRTELCHEVRNPGAPKPQIINNQNNHLAVFGKRKKSKTHTPFCTPPFAAAQFCKGGTPAERNCPEKL